jgi:hypothetical protein
MESKYVVSSSLAPSTDIYAFPGSIFKVVKLLHNLNILYPIVERDAGKLIVVKLLHPEKTASPNVVNTVLLIVTCSNDVQPRNAVLFIVIIPVPI